jgi:hypothetical protein
MKYQLLKILEDVEAAVVSANDIIDNSYFICYCIFKSNVVTTKKSTPALAYVRKGVKYTERLANNMGRSFSWVWKNFWTLKTKLFASTASGSKTDTALRIIGMVGNVLLHLFLLTVRLFWSFLQSI